MERILVATDFSTRSDRALRRAILIAAGSSVELVLVHAVDADQPPRLVDVERTAAEDLLTEMAETIRRVDGLRCRSEVRVGDPFEALGDVSRDLGADLLLMGPHRRQVFRDIFVGTTVQRVINRSETPVLMANAVPSAPYRSILIATDLSEGSATAIAAARRLGLFEHAAVSFVHAFAAPAESMILRAGSSMDAYKAYLAEERSRASAALSEFLGQQDVETGQWHARLIESTAAATIRACARELEADLLVIGKRGRSGLEKLIMGSVAEGVLRTSDVDVLVVPPGGS